MSGAPVVGPNGGAVPSWLARAWRVASDLLLVTAIVWAVPLLLGALAAAVRWIVS